MPNDNNADLKVIEHQLENINDILQKLIVKFDTLQSQVNSSNLKLLEIDTWRKVSNVESKLEIVTTHSHQIDTINSKIAQIENLKTEITQLKEMKTKFTILMSIGTFVLTNLITLALKFLIN